MRHLPLLCVLLLAGCDLRETTWEGSQEEQEGRRQLADNAAPGPQAPKRTKVVLFAPVGTAPIAAANPDAAADWASSMAMRVKLLSKSATGRHSAVLPASDSDAWSKGPVAATRGAYLVVLTTIASVVEKAGPPGPQGRGRIAVAEVRMRGLDPDGNLVFDKVASGEAEIPTTASPKFTAPDSQPPSVAAWDACSRAVGALVTFLDQRNEAGVELSPVDPAALVEVRIDSTPRGADVIIDDVFRGNTPLTLKVPSKVAVVRLELAGHQPWQKAVKLVQGLDAKPVLAPVGAAPADKPAPAPADAPFSGAPGGN